MKKQIKDNQKVIEKQVSRKLNWNLGIDENYKILHTNKKANELVKNAYMNSLIFVNYTRKLNLLKESENRKRVFLKKKKKLLEAFSDLVKFENLDIYQQDTKEMFKKDSFSIRCNSFRRYRPNAFFYDNISNDSKKEHKLLTTFDTTEKDLRIPNLNLQNISNNSLLLKGFYSPRRNNKTSFQTLFPNKNFEIRFQTPSFTLDRFRKSNF